MRLKIETVPQLRTALENGDYAWPGGYPLYYRTSDGAALSPAAVRENQQLVEDSIANQLDDGWRVVFCAINWEDNDLVCEDNGDRIPSAYGEGQEDAEVNAAAFLALQAVARRNRGEGGEAR